MNEIPVNTPFRHTCDDPHPKCECWQAVIDPAEGDDPPVRYIYLHSFPYNRAERRRMVRRRQGRVTTK